MEGDDDSPAGRSAVEIGAGFVAMAGLVVVVLRTCGDGGGDAR